MCVFHKQKSEDMYLSLQDDDSIVLLLPVYK